MANGKEGNSCYGCPHRGKVTGSAHSSCKNPLIQEIRHKILERCLFGLLPEISLNGDPMIQINEHGFKNGWAMFPIKFDPVWITCHLPITADQAKELGDKCSN
jgi:hypothetical protein